MLSHIRCPVYFTNCRGRASPSTSPGQLTLRGNCDPKRVQRLSGHASARRQPVRRLKPAECRPGCLRKDSINRAGIIALRIKRGLYSHYHYLKLIIRWSRRSRLRWHIVNLRGRRRRGRVVARGWCCLQHIRHWSRSCRVWRTVTPTASGIVRAMGAVTAVRTMAGVHVLSIYV